jgi:septal ring factor EnvC (AmiA/AmiB activator)
MSPEALQAIITAILSGGFVGGAFSLFTKKSRSPESQNDLARLGNEFAAQLLEDARKERTELRLTISELEQTNKEHVEASTTKQESIDRLKRLLEDKNDRIRILETQRETVAQKLQNGEKITLADIFGRDAPKIQLFVDESIA